VTPAKPAYETVRSREWIAAAAVLLGALAFAYAGLFAYSFKEWLKPDYSHGFLVPFFSAFLFYRSWPAAPRKVRWPEPWGLAFLAAGMGLFLFAGNTNIAKEWLQGLSLVINLCGVLLLLGGWPVLRWGWPPVAFLIFMFPLPYRVEHWLGGELQKLAAAASAFVLQTIGYPTLREGVILHVQDHTLEVEKACNGLSMLLTFVALSVGMVLVVRRAWLDKALILVAAVPVAILSNVARIALTGVLYNEAGKELGDNVFHDFAGWLMMPFALLVLWLGLKLLDWVFVPQPDGPDRDALIRANVANPVHLFMHAVPGVGGKTAPPPGTGPATAPPSDGAAR